MSSCKQWDNYWLMCSQSHLNYCIDPLFSLQIISSTAKTLTTRMSTSSYLLVSAVVMAMSGGVRSGSEVGRGGAMTVSGSGLRSQ